MGRKKFIQMKRLDAAFQRIVKIERVVEQNLSCCYCHEPMTFKKSTLEHRHPKSKGGTNRKDNLAASCLHCNSTKANMTEQQFLREIKKPPHEQPNWEFVRIWMRRKIWLATERACARITRVCR